ncbi:MAG: GNAT family N-acetyltransferase [Pseudomonadota bacterium]
MRIKLANLDSEAFHALIDTHAALMLSLSPPDSCHFLNIDDLRTPDITVWEIYNDAQLVGCGGLKDLSSVHGEIKSMHTLNAWRGRGFGRAMLEHILQTARSRSYQRLSLETGSMDGFRPARRLYELYGFIECGPFGNYENDPNSLFMTLVL